jgi:hypothetical protein
MPPQLSKTCTAFTRLRLSFEVSDGGIGDFLEQHMRSFGMRKTKSLGGIETFRAFAFYGIAENAFRANLQNQSAAPHH